MSSETNKALYRRWIDSGFNSGDPTKVEAAVDEFFSPDYTDGSVPPGFPRTIEAPKKLGCVCKVGKLSSWYEDMS